MKQPGISIEHENEEFLVVEGGYSLGTRSLSFLVRPGGELFPRDPELKPIEWRDQGHWYPVARQAIGLTQFAISEDEQHRDLVETLLERYLREQPEPEECAWVPLAEKGEPLGSLEKVVPMGLVVPIYDSAEAAHEHDDAASVEALTNVPLYLTHLARNGYAGGLWNAQLPIFFCTDESGDLQFLRLSRGGQGKVEMDIVEPTGEWSPYEGAEEIEFLDNREACDERLVASFGEEPLFDWPDDDSFWSVGPSETEAGRVMAPEDGLNYVLLFSEQEEAKAWLEDSEFSWKLIEVPDVREFLGNPALEGLAALVNPGAHRVRSGVLWLNGENLILDSFSGFWLRDGDGFVKAE
ncbi:MAG: hypothetical protein DHS20C15_27750 [Planctomycetota bacterium]|nr:MAG: hypothetical protein DHS20C15_27750 [Planctomycetota bacterium]